MCVCARAIDKECHEFVRAHVKDIEWLAYWNVRWDMCSLSLWHGYLPAALDYRCVVGEEGGPINYREVDRLVYVWRRRETWLCIEEDRSASMHMCSRGIRLG